MCFFVGSEYGGYFLLVNDKKMGYNLFFRSSDDIACDWIQVCQNRVLDFKFPCIVADGF